MKLPKFITKFFAAAPLAAYNSPYESANYSPNRGRVPGGAPKDEKHELTEPVRMDISTKTRYASKNSGQFREIVRSNAIYAIGHGLTIQSNADDSGADKLETYFNLIAPAIDITGRFSFADVQRLASRALDIDGELFLIKVYHPQTGEPCVQVIRSHRVGDFGKGDTQDGIKFTPWGAPAFYRVLQDDGSTKDFPAWQVIHVFDPESPDAVRFTSPLQHGADHTLDEREMLSLEKQAVKANIDIAHTITTPSGDLGEEGDFRVGPAQAGGEGTDPKLIQKIIGGRVVALQPGEELEPFQPSRPSPVFTGFLEHINRAAAMGSLPYEFIANPNGVNGGAIRLITSKADRAFAARQDVIIQRLIRPIWFFFIGDAIHRKILPVIARWWEIECGTPKRVTVDAGRDASANREDLEMGIKCFSDHYGEQGAEFKREVRRRAREIKFIERVATEEGVDSSKLYKPTRTEAKAIVGEDGAVKEDLKTRFDYYGVGVRAGAITPSRSDEETFRAMAGLPPMSKEVQSAWDEDGGVRRPITLVQAAAPAAPGQQQQSEE